MDIKQSVKILKALSDENRLNIIMFLQDGEKCACNLLDLLNIGQSTLSHHMKILCDSGIVSARKEGKWTHYSLNKKAFDHIKEISALFEKK